MSDEIARARKSFAKEICFISRVDDPRVIEAFAKVPREVFLGKGPWRIASSWPGFRTTPSDDPRHVYCDAVIALDERRRINNGQPSLYAALFEALNLREGETVAHIGAGTGYYSALLAELVGPAGDVVAIEIEPTLAQRARAALTPWPQVEVVAGNALEMELPRADAILASAGLTFPPAPWVRALKPGGRMFLPLTTSGGGGRMLLVVRPQRDGASYVAQFSEGVMFIGCVGAHDLALDAKLAKAFAHEGGDEVKSLRLDPHAPDSSCWLHGEECCLSKREPA